jgi:hypothetical protein
MSIIWGGGPEIATAWLQVQASDRAVCFGRGLFSQFNETERGRADYTSTHLVHRKLAMHKNLTAAALVLVLAFAACSDSKEGGEAGTPAQNIPESEPAGVGGTSNN